MIVEHLLPLAEPISAVHPYPGNPRVGDVEVIKRSLTKHGQFKPIVANRPSKDILAGNHVWQAICELGWDAVAVVWVDVDEDQAREMVLVDNRAAELGTFNDDALAELLAEVAPESLIDVGYTLDELDDLMALVDDGDFTPYSPPVEAGVEKAAKPSESRPEKAEKPEPMDAYDGIAERGAKEPQTPKGVSADEYAIIQFRDFRAKVTRPAYDEFRSRMLAEHGTAAAAATAMLAALGFEPDEIEGVRRDEHHDDRTR